MKIYSSGTTNWTWSARTSDHDAHEVYVTFDTAGVYTLEISGRSKYHALDRIVLFKDEAYSVNQATDENIPATVCQIADSEKKSLTVNNGIGSGMYFSGSTVAINASIPDSMKFSSWTGDISAIQNTNSPNTYVEIGQQDINITANFEKLATYTLTVINGNGSGTYNEGQLIAVSANSPEEGFLFDRWIGDVNVLQNIFNPLPVITMTQNINLEATYKPDPDAVVANILPRSEILVFPNPVIEQINIRATETVHVRLFSPTGKLIMEKTSENEIQIPAISLPKGVYMLKINDERHRIIKQ